jgi:hypothetical protein
MKIQLTSHGVLLKPDFRDGMRIGGKAQAKGREQKLKEIRKDR